MSRTDTPPEGGDGGVEQVLTGIPVCGGAAIGVAHCTHEPEPEPGPDGPIDPAAVEAEITRLDVATARARKQIDRLRDRLRFKEDELQRELGPLLDAYDRMLGSTRLRAGMRRRIRDGLASAERAVHDEVEHAANHLLALPEEDAASLQRRASEVREIGRRLRRNLLAAPFRPLGSAVPRGAILLADRLSPAEIALLDPTRIAGIAVEGGGSADHTAVMLASLGIPAVVGVRHLNALASDGTEVALDGARGTVVLNPSPAREEETRRAVSAEARARQRLGRLRRLPARLLTGEDVELQANLDLPAELPPMAAGLFGALARRGSACCGASSSSSAPRPSRTSRRRPPSTGTRSARWPATRPQSACSTGAARRKARRWRVGSGRSRPRPTRHSPAVASGCCSPIRTCSTRSSRRSCLRPTPVRSGSWCRW